MRRRKCDERLAKSQVNVVCLLHNLDKISLIIKELIMPKHQVDIEIIGSGTQVFLYVIGDATLEELVENSKLEKQQRYYEILDGSEDVECHHICTGIDLIDGDYEIVFNLDGILTTINDVVNLSIFDEDELPNIANSFIYDDENVSDLEGSVPEGRHVIIVAESFRDGVLQASFKADEPIKPEELRLEFIDLDGSSDFSECTYHLGTSGSIEYELASVLYQGTSYEFDFTCSNFKSREIYLVTRNKKGELKISPKSKNLFY